jgi:putative secretion activating protein
MNDVLNLNNKKEDSNSIDAIRKDVVQKAREQVNKRKGNNYVWGRKGPDLFDCSGLTKYVYNKAGLYIPDGSRFQAQYGGLKPDLRKKDLKEGDLVFFGSGKVSHVGIYIGNNQIIDSGGVNSKGKGGEYCTIQNPCEGVRVKSLNNRSDFRGGISLEKILEKNKADTKLKNKGTIKKKSDNTEKTVSAPQKSTVNNDKRIKNCLDYIFQVEGGYNVDQGGPTRYGIIQSEARKHGYTGSMKDFPKDKAKEIYIKDYYYGNKIDKINDERVALSVFDWTVNSGGAKKQIQKMLNKEYGLNLTVDGIIGPKTLDALNGVNQDSLLKNIATAQRNYYTYLAKSNPEKNGSSLKGWYNRLDSKEKYINKNLNKTDNENLSNKLKEAVSKSLEKATKETTQSIKKSENVR